MDSDDWAPRSHSDWWEPMRDGLSRCRIHGGTFTARCDGCAFNLPPKASADLETPDYWRSCESEIYGPPQSNGMERIGGFVRHVIGRGPRLRCDYHGSLHVTFAPDEACIDCMREEVDGDLEEEDAAAEDAAEENPR